MRENLPGFSFRLVEINIDKTELQRVRKETILDLLNPLNTVLDDSIGKFMLYKGTDNESSSDHLKRCVTYSQRNPLNLGRRKCLIYPCFSRSKNDNIFFTVTQIKVQMLPL